MGLLRGWITPILIGALLLGTAQAAPDRLNDDVPDAIPDHPGAVSLSFGYESLGLDGPGTGETTAHMYLKGRYMFSDTVAASLRITDHDLAGGLGLLSPLLDNLDGARSYTLDLSMNLLNVAPKPADPLNALPFEAGSSFNAGVSGTQYEMEAGDLSRDELLLKAYLAYSTDLTEEMRAHTYFSTGRLSGDTHTGSMNRVGAGLDYTLSAGRRPLVLMANGILDIYNFREPTFNTGRVSRFDLGMRYQFSRDWYASLGWVTANDSENEASGSGVYAGVNFLSHPGSHDNCSACGTKVPETAPGVGVTTEAPVEPAPDAAPAEAPPEEPAAPAVQDAVRGIAIPSFTDIPPEHTTAESRLVRAGQDAAPSATPAPAVDLVPDEAVPVDPGAAAPTEVEPAPEAPAPETPVEGDAVETVDQPAATPPAGEEQPDGA